MAHDEAIKREARTLYVHKRLALTSIAVSTGVSLATINRWKREAKEAGDDWDKARSGALVNGEGLSALISQSLEDFTVQFQAVMDELKEDNSLSAAEKVKLLSTISDAFNKTVAAARRAAPKLSELAIAYDVLQRLAKFVALKRPELSETILELLEPFGDEIAEVYDGQK